PMPIFLWWRGAAGLLAGNHHWSNCRYLLLHLYRLADRAVVDARPRRWRPGPATRDHRKSGSPSSCPTLTHAIPARPSPSPLDGTAGGLLGPFPSRFDGALRPEYPPARRLGILSLKSGVIIDARSDRSQR